MLLVAELKCIACGRVCGEVSGATLAELRENAKNPSTLLPEAVIVCTLKDNTSYKCSHCGGFVYMELPDRIYPRETTTNQTAKVVAIGKDDHIPSSEATFTGRLAA